MAKAKRRKKGAAGKSTKKTRKVRRGRRAGARGVGRPAGRVTAMTQAVQGLESYRGELLAQRGQLDQQLAAVDNALREMGRAPARPPGRPAGRGRGRPAAAGSSTYRPGSLKEHIEQALAAGGQMAVKDITDAVMAGGYQTKNKTLAKSVGIALTEMPNVVKVKRGQFRLA